MHGRHRVVIIGAGFGGLAAARALRDEAVDVVVVDSNNFHTFQPLLYQVATAGLSADDIAYPVRGILRRQRNARFRMGTVTGIDLEGRTIEIDGRSHLEFDSLVVAAGAVSNSFGVPGVDDHAFGMKSVEDAEAIRASVLHEFEKMVAASDFLPDGGVESATPPSERSIMNVVVCGGGPTGVEMAGGLAELYQRVLAKDAPSANVIAARIVLVEAADRLLPPFTPESSHRARKTLAKHGVEVYLNTSVKSVGPHQVELSTGEVIPTRTCVWAAGVRAHPLAQMMGTELDQRGRIKVTDSLEVLGQSDVYAVGDIAASPWIADGPDAVCPQVAQPAIQGGEHVATQIGRRLRNEPTTSFHYTDKGSMATIGRNDAVTELPSGRRLSGFVGWVAWLALHLLELMGVRNRLNVLVSWAWNYLTYDRGARLLSADYVASSQLQESPPTTGNHESG